MKPINKEKDEYILCAAIWYKELPIKDDSWLRLRGVSPYNVDRGIVFCGWRHTCCIAQMNAMTSLRQCEAGEEIQGFLTSKNRFVDRKEASKIAYKSKQIGKELKTLYSEDLY